MTHSKKFILSFAIICAVLVLGGAWYFLHNQWNNIATSIDSLSQWTDNIAVNTWTQSSIWLHIMVPADLTGYSQKMADFVQVGWEDPLKTQIFVQKIINTPYSGDIKQASAELAAQQFSTGGGPAKVLVNYFKVLSGTAYVVLNIDENGRAGVSVSIARIHPVVEKTLLQFPEIHSVVFGYASGDMQFAQTGAAQ